MPIDHVLWIDTRALDIIIAYQKGFSSPFLKRRMPEAMMSCCTQSALDPSTLLVHMLRTMMDIAYQASTVLLVATTSSLRVPKNWILGDLDLVGLCFESANTDFP